ncbi:MAG: hypothetical protein D6706_09750 [Chloroflexi bacterium]|nr:MAG: hypothetical protein D6706_09750 [Chloroflexota bacterium]
MTQRIQVLTRYFFRRLVFSFSGLIYMILALAFWAVLFPPTQQTPDIAYYVIVIGAFGAAISFLSTLSIASRANEAENYPVIVRLPGRIEYLTAVLVSALLFTLILQLLVALLALFRGPVLTTGRFLELPPLWLSVNITFATLALHATDFVTAGWSRVNIYGILAILLFGQSNSAPASNWLAGQMANLSRFFNAHGWPSIAQYASRAATWFATRGPDSLREFFGVVFWPFRAMSEGSLVGRFQPVQALAPAVLLLYASILFLLAADFFANKDLDFTE